jgi:hypothetical protein
MPSESQVLRCGNCGANLSPVPGQNVVQCGYCSQATYLTATIVNAPQDELDMAAAHPERRTSVHEKLLSGPRSMPAKGVGVRFTTRDMNVALLVPQERAIWPVRAAASTTFGSAWSPSAMVGPPKVFPRYGDIGGAWAPSSNSSPVEWVELEYHNEFPVSGLRVYETNKSGCVYAVVDHTSGEDVLFVGPVDPRSEACALDVTLDAPRVIRKLRVYLTNVSGYVEIDTVALLSRDPLPLTHRPHIPPPTKQLSVSAVGWLVFGVFAALVIGIVLLVSASGGSDSPATPTVMTPAAESVPGTTIAAEAPALDTVLARNPVWAASVVDFSTEYGSSASSASQVLGPPNVYPRAGDIPEAWATLVSDGGLQHITVAFDAPVAARAVVWLATFNPGAVVRVDDLTTPGAPVTLWTGTDPSAQYASAVVTVSLPAPRTIQALRLYLDTNAVMGWNELDAIGLVP